MLVKSLRLIAVVVLVGTLALALPYTDALAQQRGGGGRGEIGRNSGGRNFGGGGRHYYRNGGWYKHGWLGFDIAVGALAIGAIIDSLPPRHNTVVVAGTPYYYSENYYYSPYQYGGYVVVPPPVLAQPAVVMPQQAVYNASPMAQPQTQDVSTINIPNSRGGYTAVTLRRAGTGYVGPQGEYYSDNPTVEQLKVLYGK